MTIRLTLLGGLTAAGEARELDRLLAQRGRAALFVYLAVERRVSRAGLTTVFWPESDEKRARQALRQGLYRVRGAVGAEWLESIAHELRVTDVVRTDVGGFTAALERGEAEAAARLYGGRFLDGVHLLDVKPWEQWVDGRRALHARQFRSACREWVEARRAAADLAGAIAAARHWLAADPLDDEAQHRLIEALAAAGERGEAIRQYESYLRLLEPEGLRPLADTVELMERVRAVPLPRAPAVTEAPPAPTPTADVEEVRASPPSPRPGAARPRRRTMLVAIASLGLLTGAVWVLEARSARQPLTALFAGGSLEPGARIVIADFAGPPANPAVAPAVTDALRIDLLSTDVVRVLDSSEVREILERMQTANGASLTPERAREVALRGGAEAILEGEIAQAGSGYLLNAVLRAAASGRTVAAFRETARGPDELIPAIDRLSRSIRRRAGESLRSVEAGPPLERVTTASLHALRAYGEADRAFRRWDVPHAVTLLDEALELDPKFAMAWRLLAVALSQSDPDRAVEATRRAYELRDRLSFREHHLAVAMYKRRVERDAAATIEAYRRLLEVHRDDDTALNNLGLLYREQGELGAAAERFRHAVERSRPSAITYLNLIHTELARDSTAAAAAFAEALASAYPDAIAADDGRFWVLIRQGDDARARALFEPVTRDATRSAGDRALAHDRLARLALRDGRLADARDHLEAAERFAADTDGAYDPLAWKLSRAHAEAMVGDPQRAARLLREAIDPPPPDLRPPGEAIRVVHATVLAVAGSRLELEALLRFLESRRLASGSAGGHADTEVVRAFAFLLAGEPESAVQAVERARDANACRVCFALPMAWALHEAGRPREAAAELEALIGGRDTRDPGIQLAEKLWALQRIPRLYQELGDTASALRHARGLAELWQRADPELRSRLPYARERRTALLTSGR